MCHWTAVKSSKRRGTSNTLSCSCSFKGGVIRVQCNTGQPRRNSRQVFGKATPLSSLSLGLSYSTTIRAGSWDRGSITDTPLTTAPECKTSDRPRIPPTDLPFAHTPTHPPSWPPSEMPASSTQGPAGPSRPALALPSREICPAGCRRPARAMQQQQSVQRTRKKTTDSEHETSNKEVYI